MNFLFLLIIAAVAVYLLRRPLKAHPSFFYGIAVILDLLYFVGSTFGVPRWLWTPLVDLSKKCELALALFAIVMFIGCLGKEQALYRQMKPIRAELSIVACILCFGHMAVYLDSYLPRLLGNASINGNVAVAFGVAVALFVLLALLGVTSLGIVKRAMSSRRWDAHPAIRLLILRPDILPSCAHASSRRSAWRHCRQESLFIYTAMFRGLWNTAFGQSRRRAPRASAGKRDGVPSITREEETSIGNAA